MDVLGKAEALERQFKTVTMRADSLLVTESDFLQTILKRCTKKTQNHVNALISTAEYGPAADRAPKASSHSMAPPRSTLVSFQSQPFSCQRVSSISDESHVCRVVVSLCTFGGPGIGQATATPDRRKLLLWL